MERYLFLIPLLPLAAFVVNILLGRTFIRDRAHWVAVPAVFVSWLLSVFVLFDLRGDHAEIAQHLFTWIPAGDFQIEVNLFADHLTAVMLLVVTTVGLLVHVYSIGYMHGDGGYYRFFAYLPLFVFSMLMLVLADNFLLLFVFWEAVGLCSYLLIGYWFKRRSAANAAKKAFIVNRIGDVGFGLAIMWTFAAFGTVAFHGADGVFARVGEITTGTLTGIALLFFLGACGKSAQFPLHVWLPDAMEGPTPVSALIHAATMVTAGIYLVARAHTIFAASQTALWVVAIIGAFTAFMAATIGWTQFDIKRVVAYSTLSQLGYMCFALGTGAWIAAIFHLMTHAFFKGLLFLGSGSVIHGMHEEQDIRRMGGLHRYMPITSWTFLMASLANAGVIIWAGFWSKDEILVGSWFGAVQPIGTIVSVVGFITAFLSALYMFRLYFIVFRGSPRFDTAQLHPHESPPTMSVPLVLLAIPSVLIGVVVGFPPENGLFHRYLAPVFAEPAAAPHEEASLYAIRSQEEPGEAAEGEAEHEATGAGSTTEGEHAAEGGEHHLPPWASWVFGIVSTIFAVGGVLVARANYGNIRTADEIVARDRAMTRGLYDLFYNKWYWDERYNRWFVQPARDLAMFLWQVVDVGIIDATVNGVATGIGAISQRLRHVQTGLVANYALAIALGMVIMVGVYLGLFSDLFR